MEDIVMSKWRKPLKNQKRFDARYFLNERVENQEEVMENSVQQEKLKKNFHDFSFDSWLDEGADKGTPEWSKPTEDTEKDPIDYDHGESDGKIGGSVVEEENTVIGSAAEKEEYGEQEADDSESDESAPAIKEYRGPGDDEDLYTPGGKLRPSKMQRAKRERELDAERKRDAAAKAKRGKQRDDAKAAWKAHMAKNES